MDPIKYAEIQHIQETEVISDDFRLQTIWKAPFTKKTVTIWMAYPCVGHRPCALRMLHYLYLTVAVGEGSFMRLGFCIIIVLLVRIDVKMLRARLFKDRHHKCWSPSDVEDAVSAGGRSPTGGGGSYLWCSTIVRVFMVVCIMV